MSFTKYDITKLDPKDQRYVIELTNGSEHYIDGEAMNNIIASTSQFIRLKGGSLINRSCIIEIRADREKTLNPFLSLPEAERKKLSDRLKMD